MFLELLDLMERMWRIDMIGFFVRFFVMFFLLTFVILLGFGAVFVGNHFLGTSGVIVGFGVWAIAIFSTIFALSTGRE